VIQRLAVAVFALTLVSTLSQPAGAEYDDVCLDCHEADDDVGRLEDLDDEIHLPSFEAAVHAGISCTDCHVDATEDHSDSDEPLARVFCEDCHAQEAEDFSTGIHGQLLADGDPDAPQCEFCHGIPHYILSQRDPKSRTFPLNVPALCAECHSHGERAAIRNHASEDRILQNYTMSIHGKGLRESGLLVSATCSKCHTPHKELPASDPRSSVHRANVTETCGSCHYGIFAILRQSVHSPEVTETAQRLPTCNDCHTSHRIQRVEHTAFRFEIIDQCGSCHEELIESYFESYHGKVSKLGGGLTAKCYDCHGSHEILPVSNPDSMLHEGNIVATCGKCHSGSNAGFVQYLPHATHDDREKYPELFYTYWAMTLLLIGTFAFFGVHTILWFVRSFIESRRGEADHAGEESESLPYSAGDEEIYFRRFQPNQILLHITVIITFLTLVFTGMCLKFSDNPHFASATALFGGPVVLGVFHRICAVLTFAYFGAHLLIVLMKLRRGEISLRGLLTEDYSLIPLPRDFVAMKDNFAWFLGLGPRPQLGRWTYWEKFDYMAVFWGVTIIGITGLIMWFAEQVTLLLPGWMINVATVIHSDEALLAAAFIFTVHFFNGHFRPGKFPMDLVIFTGCSTLAELKREHPQQYRALVESGELENYLVPPPPRWVSRLGAIFGTLFLVSGLVLISAILYSLAFI
jgi:cytochrome b subunit of formate dehydrogenase/nitrate/TMAO reductase-like tetraheme cytochrome c subunit